MLSKRPTLLLLGVCHMFFLPSTFSYTETEDPALEEQMGILLPKEEWPTLINKVETYMRGIKSLAHPFIQNNISPDGRLSSTQGLFFLSKTNRTRSSSSCNICFDYPEQHKKIFVLNKTLLIKEEGKADKISSLSAIPVSHIFDQEIDIEQFFSIKQIGIQIDKQLGPQKEQILFLQMVPYCAKSAVLTLFFKTYPNGSLERLVGWSLSQKKQGTVYVTFDEQKMRVNDPRALPQNLFDVALPSKKQSHKRSPNQAKEKSPSAEETTEETTIDNEDNDSNDNIYTAKSDESH